MFFCEIRAIKISYLYSDCVCYRTYIIPVRFLCPWCLDHSSDIVSGQLYIRLSNALFGYGAIMGGQGYTSLTEGHFVDRYMSVYLA